MTQAPAKLAAVVAALVLPVLAFGGAASPQTVQNPAHAVADPGVITTRQIIAPAGAQTVFKGPVNGVAFGKDGELWVMTNNRQNQVLSQRPLGGSAGLRSLAFDEAGARPIAGYAASNEVRLSAPQGAALSRVGPALGRNIVGAMIVRNGKLFAPMIKDNKLAMVDLAAGTQTSVNVGIAPVAVAASNRFA